MKVSECIIVVVGSNPLPNLLVVATEMAYGKPFKIVHLVNSEEIKRVAKRLATVNLWFS